MAAHAQISRPAAFARRGAGIVRVRLSAVAWSSIVLVALFILATCWWLNQDHSIPVFDAGLHLDFAINVHEALSAGHLLRAFTASRPYPPLTYLVGALGIFAGGVDVAPPIVAQNVVFVPLLALGCYKVARMAFDPLAGALAVVFALGTPLVVEGFHEFMLDAPEAAMVAVSVWAVLATQRFAHVRTSALAGLVVGFGMLSKETFVFFIAGVVIVTAVRGGRRALRGRVVFAAVVLVIAAPWYLYEFSTIHALTNLAVMASDARLPAGIAPPRLSRENLEWYFWSLVNWQLFLPLFAFTATGFIWVLVSFVRRRPAGRFMPELAVGAFVSWVALTMTFLHDLRYSIPMEVYFAVFGVGWVSRLPRPPRAALATALAVIALANVLGVGFGVGEPLATTQSNVAYEQQPGRLTLYANFGVWAGAPAQDGDLLGLFRALRRDGIRNVRWYSKQEDELEFSFQGILVLARIAELGVLSNAVNPASASNDDAFISHPQLAPSSTAPCAVLKDGAGVWIRRGGAGGGEPWGYCPLPRAS